MTTPIETDIIDIVARNQKSLEHTIDTLAQIVDRCDNEAGPPDDERSSFRDQIANSARACANLLLVSAAFGGESGDKPDRILP